ncbi:E3 ubiquitin-protein ligase rnf213-alpha-like [Mya arenaria]|uniref:E3 ubiquitin-protein ligase rnf213-alpha-like n=1 Tax=Mya arenaria TaxID=6604 RepID=UPI0022E3B3AE|nr:E3 ubiquitin-protein ligase rnf213-alpha-like [Mya arenaria]
MTWRVSQRNITSLPTLQLSYVTKPTMKCPNPDCTWSGDGDFCEECGENVHASRTPITVVCNGKKPNGNICDVVLEKGKNFCKGCGTRIDQARFEKQEEQAREPEIEQGFCEECGKTKAKDQNCEFCESKSSKQGHATAVGQGTAKGTEIDRTEENASGIKSSESKHDTNNSRDALENVESTSSKKMTRQNPDYSENNSRTQQQTRTRKQQQLEQTRFKETEQTKSGAKSNKTKFDEKERTESGANSNKTKFEEKERTKSEANSKKNKFEEKERTESGANSKTQKFEEKEKTKSGANSNSSKFEENAKTKKKATTTERLPASPPKNAIRVVFHVLVAKDFLQNENNRVVLVTDNNWNDFSRETTKIKDHDDCIEYQYTIDIKKENIYEHYAKEYKYCVLDSTGKESWENYKSWPHNNRSLHLYEQKRASKSIWNQYDGVSIGYRERSTMNLVGKFRDYFYVDHDKECKENAIKSARIFCPRWFRFEQDGSDTTNADKSIQESLECMQSLYTGLDRVYRIDAQCCKSKAEFIEMLSQPFIERTLTSLMKATQSTQNYNHSLTKIIAVGLLCKQMDIKLSQRNWQCFCKLCSLSTSKDMTCPCELQTVRKTFKDSTIKQAVLHVISNGEAKWKDPSWLYCLPLLHFTSDLVRPYDKCKFDLSYADAVPTWWGIEDISKFVEAFKKCKKDWAITPVEMYKNLQIWMQMDFYLPRSFVACLSAKELLEVLKKINIPLDVCVASLRFWVDTTNPCYKDKFVYIAQGDEQIVIQCLETFLIRLKSSERNESSEQRAMAFKIAQQMFQITTQTGVFLKVIHSSHILITVARHQVQTEQDIKFTEIAAGKIVNWLKNRCIKEDRWQYYMDDYMKYWNAAFISSPTKESVEETWNSLLANSLFSTLKERFRTSEELTKSFVTLYCKQLEKFNTPLQECLSSLAAEAISAAYTVQYSHFHSNERKRFGDLLSTLFEDEYVKRIREDSDQQHVDIMQMILEWEPMKVYLRSDGANKAMISETCRDKIELMAVVVESQWNALVSGQVEVQILKLINKNLASFTNAITSLVPENRELAQQANLVIRARMKELHAVETLSKQMITFQNMCQFLRNVDLQSIIEGIQSTTEETLENQPLAKLCVPIKVESNFMLDKFEPELLTFCEHTDVLQVIGQLNTIHSSCVFDKYWIDTCHGLDLNTCKSAKDVVEFVWVPVKERFDEFVNDLKSGDIKMRTVERMIGKKYGDDFEGIQKEMERFELPQNIILVRLNQLQQNRRLELCVRGAEALLQLKKRYDLQGNFQPIETIKQHSESDIEMNKFDESVMNTCDVLVRMTDNEVACIDALVKSKPLVSWLKESMQEGGQKELKVFIDLAMMSAGEKPMDIRKVQCLHSAVMGYSPLIFDLRSSDGYEEVLQKCEHVWNYTDTNPNLPQQLVDTNRHLSWLKEIKMAHGSVEVSSLMQTDLINTKGTIYIGKKNRGAKSEADTNLEIKHILMLCVPKLESQEIQEYTYDDIQELQSKLMLVVGKADSGNTSVQRFTMIFENVIRLCKVYIDLCTSGCVMFNDWSVEFLCTPDLSKPVCATVQFGDTDESLRLKGMKSTEENLPEMIQAIARYLERCLKEWLRHIQEKRQEHLSLNYFTTDQLVILQKELVKLEMEEEPIKYVYPMLSVVKHNCTQEDVQGALEEAKREVDIQSVKLRLEKDNIRRPTEPVKVEIEQQREEFIDMLVENCIARDIAERSLDHVELDEVENLDISNALVWCMDESERVESVGDQDAFTASGPLADSSATILSVIQSKLKGLVRKTETGTTPLIMSLEEIWTNFTESVSSSIRDYLSLEHLGILLQKLEKMDNRCIRRTFPPYLKEGEPNLIVCPQDEILQTILSLYQYDAEQPLPQSDEVLLCRSNTSKDDVDVFLRRVFLNESSRIHCLAKVDNLKYDVSEHTEIMTEKYMHECSLTEGQAFFKLVVICGSENECRSNLVSSLDKYKRTRTALKQKDLQGYLFSKMVHMTDPEDIVEPAAAVDHERLTVRVVRSTRAGVGKTLYVQRKEEKLTACPRGAKSVCKRVTIPLQTKNVDMWHVTDRLLKYIELPSINCTNLYHIDVYHEVQEGIDDLLFNLVVLNCLTNRTGYVWRRSMRDLYIIETMPTLVYSPGASQQEPKTHSRQEMFRIMPEVRCRSPQESLAILSGKNQEDLRTSDQTFDEKEFLSDVYQRPFHFLLNLEVGKQISVGGGKSILSGTPTATKEEMRHCLDILLRYCGVQDPSWSELQNFVWFLNRQLADLEENVFVTAEEDLPGICRFVLEFMIQMSRDFSTSSIEISEQTPDVNAESTVESDNDVDIKMFKLRRTWETSPHPYIFFNSDKMTFTFLGFLLDRKTGNLKDIQTGEVLKQSIVTPNLYDGLARNGVQVQDQFDKLGRSDKLLRLCKVMGVSVPTEKQGKRDVEVPVDPDSTYELTTDNVKKMLAIYMRFRCDIPVIVMGETGCGKTRLVKFLCALQCPHDANAENMIIMKIHGGTTVDDISKKVLYAERKSIENANKFGKDVYTVLFFDEANTTEAIGVIKEIICDRSVDGRQLTNCPNLKFVAACNPYRRHPEELIKKLENAGLGYHVDAEKTNDRLGKIPMRRLVYRVQPLSRSLLPFVWDFGQLNTEVEVMYIRQMVIRYIQGKGLDNSDNLTVAISEILSESQEFMRKQKDECSFVSLRDVERSLIVMLWFYKTGKKTLFPAMNELLGDKHKSPDDISRSLILALGVCYHACLSERSSYRTAIASKFKTPLNTIPDEKYFLQEIDACQSVFLNNVDLAQNIARNAALKENVFMMVVCVELRIPLFLVGKPGSSKSLAKTIVDDAMQGPNAAYDLYKELKQVQIMSYQCSPLSTAEGIVGTFKQCAGLQKNKNLEQFVSVVVLDEVGLAEDSPKMPLKTLHPLLEDGCDDDSNPSPEKKVSFIGISNWALDPAKMNRGILVQRAVPDIKELKISAQGICDTTEELKHLMNHVIGPLADSYLEVFKLASKERREFFGLRDFYSLMKMVYCFVKRKKEKPTWPQILYAIKRNFGGLDSVDPVHTFKDNLRAVVSTEEHPDEIDTSPSGLIQACLFDIHNMNIESRYLLLLTENYGALTIIQQQIFSGPHEQNLPETIFGSSFRSDQEYTQICRNINRIKVCMETGQTVILLNLENLYESLYDALNQYYVKFGGERFVDLGLGTHRVKCPVHRDFRLIVVAETKTVYEHFPIPLINRLEKHFLNIDTMLNDEHRDLVKELRAWSIEFTKPRQRHMRGKQTLEDVFVGYHDDTFAAIVLFLWDKFATEIPQKLLEEGKKILMWCATPEAMIARDDDSLMDIYSTEQQHESLEDFLNVNITQNKQNQRRSFTQVTTHSKLMAGVHKTMLSTATDISQNNTLLLESLTSFDTEQEFTTKLKQHVDQLEKNTPSLLVVQCESGDKNANLIACARYCIMAEVKHCTDIHVVFIVQLPRKAGGSFKGFQCGVWRSVHIDEIHSDEESTPHIRDLKGKALSEVFSYTAVEIQEKPTTVHSNQADGDTSDTDDSGDEAETERKTTDIDDEEDATAKKETTDRLDTSQNTIEGLIVSCVQLALSHVKDVKENRHRETERIDIVLKCLQRDKNLDNDKVSFVRGIQACLAKLLREKENDVQGQIEARNWLNAEASASEEIAKAGTFRRSCVRTIMSKVSPILAGLIGYIDTNKQLDILYDGEEWKRGLFLQFLNTPDVLRLQYSDLRSPTGREVQDVIVQRTGCDGHIFDAEFPFSWSIIDFVNEIMGGSAEQLSVYANIMRNSSVGKVLDGLQGDGVAMIRQNGISGKVLESYIHDFVHTVYRVERETELKVVSKYLQERASSVLKMSQSDDEKDIHLAIVCIHFAYLDDKDALFEFRFLNTVWKDCCTAIIDIPTTYEKGGYLANGLAKLLHTIKPQKSDLTDRVAMITWLHKVQSCRPAVENVLSFLTKTDEKPTEIEDTITVAKSIWCRISVMKLFIEHVCISEDDTKATVKQCSPLWNKLEKGNISSFKEITGLESIETFLKFCSKIAGKIYLVDEMACCICGTNIEGPPVTLPCKHLLCNGCYNEKIALPQAKQCVDCQEVIPDTWSPEQSQENWAAIQRLGYYQRRCNSFFMNIVSQLCFADNTAPSKAVISKLLGYITFVSKEGKRFTKNMNIFNTGVDLNPVFRSYLLQLMIKTSESHVTGELKEYFDNAGKTIGEQEEARTYMTNLCLLVIHCLEDALMLDMLSKQKQEGVAVCCQIAKQIFADAIETLNGPGISLEKVKVIANIRAALTFTAQCLERNAQSTEEVVDVNEVTLLREANTFCRNCSTLPKRFLVKYICRKYGCATYQSLCDSTAEALNWVDMHFQQGDRQISGYW